jgi:putative ATP-dependent endonuclease of the OLD family
MWISNVSIENFRKASDGQPITITFCKGLNLLIGENNVGKTCVVEAIALTLGYGNPDRSVFLKEQDFSDPNKPLTVTLEFEGMTEDQEAAFLQALVLEEGKSSKAKFQFSFDIKNNKISSHVACGEHLETTAPIELIRSLRVMYLPALRDADKEFHPGYKSRVGKILKTRYEVKDQGHIEEIFRDANTKALEHNAATNPVTLLTKKANESIDKLSFQGSNNRIKFEFVEQNFARIISNISMKTFSGLNIDTNGLGYNNLIYIATILTELEYEHQDEPHTFSCLLIEEPEAHLHPQLQTLLLEFVQDKFPSIQIILTSHSPSLVAATRLNNLSIMSLTSSGVINHHVTTSNIDPTHKIFLERFMDVTKSQLFFSRNIIFVEGITEAVLLELFWNLHYSSDDQKFSRQSIEVVNINGVAFEPYTALIKGIFAQSHVKCVILSDDDRGSGRTCPVDLRFKHEGDIRNASEIAPIFPDAPISSRALKLKSAVEAIKTEGFTNLSISLGRKTFEVEFALANISNKALLEEVAGVPCDTFKDLADTQAAIEFWKTIVEKDGKTDASAKIAEKILAKVPVKVPQHFITAFEFITPKIMLNGNETDPTTKVGD